MDASQVIIRPVVSEKSYVLATAGKYTFRVHPDAHKTQIKQAVEELFDVAVRDVRTISVPSKPKRRGYNSGRTREWKKAVVQLAEGQSIPIFQGLEADL
jgi:large subunit ribosomal protein L23